MAERKEYLEQLKAWKDEQVIKVVTGILRCGKSTLLLEYQQQLKTTGITDEQIVSVNFEELEYEELLDYRKLYSYLKERLCAEKTTYKTSPASADTGGREKILWAYCKGSAQRWMRLEPPPAPTRSLRPLCHRRPVPRGRERLKARDISNKKLQPCRLDKAGVYAII